MTTPDQLEFDSAWRLRDVAMGEAVCNCENQEDWYAASVAMLTLAIEIINKEKAEND